MKERDPRWESELWSYVSTGDGAHCPIYSHCQVRQRSGWCPSDNIECFNQLLDIDQFNPSNYAAIGDVTPCRIFQLVEMLAENFLRKGKVHCPPVSTQLVSLVDEQHPIEVRLVPLTVHHGAIWRLNDTWVVQLNANDTPATRRFTLFHEAFHILAHRRAVPVFNRRGLKAGPFNEMLAEYFATCILLPRQCYDQGLKVSTEASAGEVEQPWAIALRWIQCRLSLSMATAVLILNDEWQQAELLYRNAAESMFFNIDQKDNSAYQDICGVLVYGSGVKPIWVC